MRAQLDRLNGVLNDLNTILTVDIAADMVNATMSLNSTRFRIEEAEELLAQTRQDAISTELFLRGRPKYETNSRSNFHSECDCFFSS